MSLRDLEADYKAALVSEFESYKAAGRDDAAAGVAAVLKEQYGHEVDAPAKRQAAKKASAPERADQKAPEQAVPEKPTA